MPAHCGHICAASVRTLCKSAAQAAPPAAGGRSWHDTRTVLSRRFAAAKSDSMQNPAKNVYLIHGWATNHHIFDDLIPRLPADWRIHAPDLPGHGAAPFDGTFDVAAAADALAAQIDEPACVSGYVARRPSGALSGRTPPRKSARALPHRQLCPFSGRARLSRRAEQPGAGQNGGLFSAKITINI